MNYPVLTTGALRQNFHRSDYAELIKWRRLAVAAVLVSVFLMILLLTGACHGG